MKNQPRVISLTANGKTSIMKALRISLLAMSMLAATVSLAMAQSPVLTVSGTASTIGGDDSVAVAPSLTLTYSDSIDAATVSIDAGFVSSEDMLYFIPYGNITGSYNATTGILSLSGMATAAEYQAVLRGVTYGNTSATPDTNARTISFVVGSKLYNEYNGHFYEVIDNGSSINWNTALSNAAASDFYGLQGYLVTVTSADENTFIANKLATNTWMGASDAASEGIWRWVTGPEGLEDSGQGRYFSDQDKTGSCSANTGSAVGGYYVNWRSGEPNDCGSGEDVAHFYSGAGDWNDFPASGSVSSYAIEYGGMPGDPVVQLTGSVTMSVSTNNAPTLSDSTVTTDEDHQVNIAYALGSGNLFNDADGHTIKYIKFPTLPANGTLKNAGTAVTANTVYPASDIANMEYYPDYNWNGTDSFTWNGSDGIDYAASAATMNVDVAAVNDTPVIANSTIYIDEDAVINIVDEAPANIYIDYDNDPIMEFMITSLPTHGTLEYRFGTVVANTAYSQDDLLSMTYRPDANWSGNDLFEWNASDGTVYAVASAKYGIVVQPVNDEPVVYDVQVSTDEDVALSLVSNFPGATYTDTEGDAITKVKITSLPTNGVLTVNGNPVAQNDEIDSSDFAGLVYTPNANYFGTDAFDYNSYDGTDYARNDATVTIEIRSINDTITGISLSNDNVDENSPIGTVVGDVVVADNDVTDSHTITLVTGASYNNTLFDVVGGQLVTAASLDYETNARLDITIQANDGHGSNYIQTVTVFINDVNDQPSDVALSTTDIDETTTNGGYIATISTTDQDNPDTHTYSLVSGTGDVDNASFAINSNVLVSNTSFNINSQSSYSIRLASTDAGGLTVEKQINLNVVDGNFAPTGITIDNAVVAENSGVGAIVGTFATTDADVTDTHTYTLVAGNGDDDNASFSISGSQLLTAIDCDAETQSSFSIRVRSTDNGGASTEEEFTVTVIDINEAPTGLTLSSNVVAENQSAGTVVGTLTVADQDAGDTHTYHLVQGAGSTDNGSFSISGNILSTTAKFDFETKDSYALRVQVTDGAGQSWTEALTVNVADMNDKPTDITVTVLDIDENSPVTSTIGYLGTVDQDAGDTHTYTFENGANDNAYFNLNSNKLETLTAVDFETRDSYTVTIRSTDAGGLYVIKSFTITVNDVNEAPFGITAVSAHAAENMPAGTVVATLSADDVDAGDTQAYNLVSGTGDTDNSLFTIVGNEIQTTQPMNYEQQNTFSVRVSVADQGRLTYESIISLSIEDANDAPVALSFTKAVNKNEYAQFGTREFQMYSADEDENGGHVTYYSQIRVTSLPTHGTLYYNGVAVTVGQLINSLDVHNMRYAPTRNYVGTDSYDWTMLDGSLESSTSGTVTLNVIETGITPAYRDSADYFANSDNIFNPAYNPHAPHPRRDADPTLGTETDLVAQSLSVAKCYPNPFADATSISYELPATYLVQIKVYDMLGKEVSAVVNDVQDAGAYTVTWNGTGNGGQVMAPGQYLIRISVSTENGENISTQTNSVIKY